MKTRTILGPHASEEDKILAGLIDTILDHAVALRNVLFPFADGDEDGDEDDNDG
jgi:hypothetical protein